MAKEPPRTMALEVRCEGRGASQVESSRKRFFWGGKTYQQRRSCAQAGGVRDGGLWARPGHKGCENRSS